jgi:hypothetical protein
MGMSSGQEKQRQLSMDGKEVGNGNAQMPILLAVPVSVMMTTN